VSVPVDLVAHGLVSRSEGSVRWKTVVCRQGFGQSGIALVDEAPVGLGSTAEAALGSAAVAYLSPSRW